MISVKKRRIECDVLPERLIWLKSSKNSLHKKEELVALRS